MHFMAFFVVPTTVSDTKTLAIVFRRCFLTIPEIFHFSTLLCFSHNFQNEVKCNVFWIENLLSCFALKNIRLCQVMCYIVPYEIPHSSGHVDDAIYVTCNRTQPCINQVL